MNDPSQVFFFQRKGAKFTLKKRKKKKNTKKKKGRKERKEGKGKSL